LKFHRRNLRDLLVDKGDVLRFLDSEQGSCAGMGGLISPNAVRWILVDHLHAMPPKQCDALLRRVNPSGACLAPFDELAKILSPRPSAETSPYLESALSPRTAHAAHASYAPQSPRQPHSAPQASLAHPYTSAHSPRTKSPHLSRNFDDTKTYHPISSTRQLSPPRSWGGGGWDHQQKTPTDRSRDCLAPRNDRWGDPLSLSYKAAARNVSPPRAVSAAKIPAYASPSFGNVSTHASTADFMSPRSMRFDGTLRSRALSPSFAARTGQGGSSLRSSSTPAVVRPGTAPAISSPRSAGFAPLPNLYSHGVADRGLGGRSHFPSMGASARSTYHASPHASISNPNASPHVPPHASRAFQEGHRREAVTAVLRLMALQGQLDMQVEDAKALIAPTVQLESIFSLLDRFHKGYIADTDLWQFTQDFGSTLSFSSVRALVDEVQLRRAKLEPCSVPGRLSLRDLGIVIHPAGSREYEAMNAAVNDEEARSINYLLRFSEPCPGCGFRVQRDADCEGCPSVRCPVCGVSFRCFMAVGDCISNCLTSTPLAVSAQYHVFRLVETTCRSAEELERSRKQLAHLPGHDVLSTLSDVFAHMTKGRHSITITDVHGALLEHNLHSSEQELQLLWHRIAPDGSTGVSFADFAHQLKPRAGAAFAM